MVEFGTGYVTPMDREYSTGPVVPEEGTNDVGVTIGDIGMSFGLGPVPNVPAVAAKMRAGSKKIELDFMGMGKGNAQGHTPGMYGKKQRQALRESAVANRVDFTTHSSVGVFGLAGQDRQGNFSREQKENSVQEIKRAIEFAADVARGGPIVVHTGEFQRPIADATWNKSGKFEAYPEEGERASYRVVDDRTGGLISEARKGRKVAKPVWKRYVAGDDTWEKQGGKKSYRDTNGQLVKEGDYVDYWGRKLDRAERVPVFDTTSNTFKIREMGWEELQEEADEMTADARKEWNKWRNSSESEKEKIEKKSLWVKFMKPEVRKEDVKVMPEEAYILATLETNAAQARGFGYYYGGDFQEHVETLEKLREAKKFYEKIEETTDEEEKWRLKKRVRELVPGLVSEDAKMPTELIDQSIRGIKRQISYAREGSASQFAQAEENVQTMRHVESAETYAMKESYDSYARAGMFALEKTKQLEKKGQLKKPLFVSMENLFPESYGSHPDEIMKLVDGSRRAMQRQLMQRGHSENQAKKLAEQSMKITFDIGHMNMWRKYWKGDHTISPEENDKAFDKWCIGTVEKLAKKNMIGHAHLVDNYGYQDDHLAPGEGNAPILEFVKVLKKNGFDGEFIVEPGADYTTDNSGFHSIMKTWRFFGSPVYGAGSGGSAAAAPKRWGDIQYSSFGQVEPPYFSFPPYTPSEDWTLWSGVQLE